MPPQPWPTLGEDPFDFFFSTVFHDDLRTTFSHVLCREWMHQEGMDSQLLDAARATRRDLPGLKRAAALIRASRDVKFDHNANKFRIGGKVASGLLRRLEKTTGWTQTNPRSRSYAETKRRASHDKKLDRSCSTWGEVHGSRVHEEVAEACRAISRLRNLRPGIRKRDPCTERILKFLHARKWIPVAPELPVGARGLATAVDLVAVDARTGDMLALEFKTGYEGEEYGVKAGDKHLPMGMRDCPRDRHELQLAATCLLMPVQPDRAYIVKPCSRARGIEWFEITWWKNRRKELESLMYP